LQVGASGDDGRFSSDDGTATNFSASVTAGQVGNHAASTLDIIGTWARFTGVSGLSGATIDAAIYSLWGNVTDSGTPLTKIWAHDVESPAAPTDLTEALAIENSGLTTAGVDWDSPGLSVSAFTESPSVISVIQEIADSFDPAEIQIMHLDDGSSDGGVAVTSSYDNDPTEAAKLDIDYTAGGGGINPTIAGAVTVGVSVAAGMQALFNEVLEGTSTVTLTPASGMDADLNYAIAGASTVGVTPAAALDASFNETLAGGSTVTLTIEAAFEVTQAPQIVGAVTVGVTPAAGLAASFNETIAGAATVGVTVASGMQALFNETLAGAVTVTLTPAATTALPGVVLRHTIEAILDGVGVLSPVLDGVKVLTPTLDGVATLTVEVDSI
jgi:hypothetical protein